MFFLSKLLPMLIYPVGMTALLIAFAGITVRRHASIARTCCLIALSTLFLASNRWVKFALARPLEHSHLSSASPPAADAIVILGGGVEPEFSPDLTCILGSEIVC